ncbi:unnamed protein product [Leptidea sinapis]|uniref:Uncharacterized protein n=1 Tax=Leptidea sinapis TaxID=189913 RepID=A0A5E4PPN4_9NEOP|nr:unnamed protein product [Leptidea sinapis]
MEEEEPEENDERNLTSLKKVDGEFVIVKYEAKFYPGVIIKAYPEKASVSAITPVVEQMTPRQQRKARKVWREEAKIRRHRLKLQYISNASVTQPCSDNKDPPPPQNINRRAYAAQQKSIRARKARNLTIRK